MKNGVWSWFSVINRRGYLMALSLAMAATLNPDQTYAAKLRDLSERPKLGSFWTTFYYVPNENTYPNDTQVNLRDLHGNVLVAVDSKFKHDVDIEGTGIIRDGRTVNYIGRVNGEIRYRFSQAKYGYGVGTCELKPFHTLAVDPNVIPLGTVVYVPAAKGIKLPNGTVHDGIFYAEDIGSAINHYHIDVFASDGYDSWSVFEKAGIKTGTYVDLFKVKDPTPNGCQTQPPQYLSPKRAINAVSRAEALQNLADEFAATGEKRKMELALDRLGELHPVIDHLEAHEIESDPSLVAMHSEAARQDIKEDFDIENDMAAVGSDTTGPAYQNDFDGETLEPGEIVVTFDDGPHPRYTKIIQKLLKELKIPAGFFEVGENVENLSKITRSLAEDGQVIGNHSFDHPELTKLSDAQVSDQLNRTQKLIQKAIGGENAYSKYFQEFWGGLFGLPREIYFPEFMRSPYGARSARTMKIITDMIVGEDESPGSKSKTLARMNHVLWNIDSLDWKDHNPLSIERRVFAQINLYKRGVILIHDIHPQSVEAAQLILPRLKREGYKLLSLYDMLVESRAKMGLHKP